MLAAWTVYFTGSHIPPLFYLTYFTNIYTILISTWKVAIVSYCCCFVSVSIIVIFKIYQTPEYFGAYIFLWSLFSQSVSLLEIFVLLFLDSDFKWSELWPLLKIWNTCQKLATTRFVLPHYVELTSTYFIICSAFLHLHAGCTAISKKLIYFLWKLSIIILFI